jgi:CheY-like chemotaxis protein/chemotaxis signal transduction protein
VGMDVVRVVTDSLGGAVRVQSELGRGTTVVLDLPLSLALLRVVLVEVNGEITAIPTSAIRRILHGAAATMQHGQVAEIEGESIPIVALTALLGQPASGAASAGATALIVETRDGRLGVTVDAVLEEQELVFQELRGPLGDQLMIAGAALLGNGEIVPILDMQALHHRVAQSGGAEIAITARPSPPRQSSGVLVVEDSLVAAEMHRGILAGAGYHVEIAHDGVEALEMLRGRQWDLVITDVDMPNMNGVELTAHLRADPRLRRLPVIIVSSRDSGDHRRTGFDAGADAYLAKGEFDQNEILALVRRFIAHGREGVTP